MSHGKTKNTFEPLIPFGWDVIKKSPLKPFKKCSNEKITLKVTAGFI
jgi:hypothetical protein